VSLPAVWRGVSLAQRIQTTPGAHLASCWLGTRSLLADLKQAEFKCDHWPQSRAEVRNIRPFSRVILWPEQRQICHLLFFSGEASPLCFSIINRIYIYIYINFTVWRNLYYINKLKVKQQYVSAFFIKPSSGCELKNVFYMQLTAFQKKRVLIYMIILIN
jgi:hypothetical protein